MFVINDKRSFGNIWIFEIDVAFVPNDFLRLPLLVRISNIKAFIHSERSSMSFFFVIIVQSSTESTNSLGLHFQLANCG